MFNKIKKSKDTNPYKGYTIKYGQMTFSDCKAKGFIPLTCSFLGHINSNGQYNFINSVTGNTTLAMGHAYGVTWYNFYNFFFDFDYYYRGDLEKMKGLTNFYLSDTGYSDNTITVNKWLEPIGGGVANRLSKWFSCLFQKGGEQYV